MIGMCPIAECDRPLRSRNAKWCDMHHQRALKRGDPEFLTPGMISRQRIAEFWPVVLANIGDRKSPCIEWPGSRSPKGYGRTNGHSSGETTVSRAVWHTVFGPIPAGLQVCHHCDNPPCARPTHLFLGTPLDNSRDMVAKGRSTLGVRREMIKRPRRRTELAIRRREVAAKARAALLARMVDLYASGLSTPQVGKAVGLDASTVYRHLAAAGVEMRKKIDYHPAPDPVEIAAQYQAGEGIKALSQRYRIEQQRATELIRSTGVEIRRPGRPVRRRAA